MHANVFASVRQAEPFRVVLLCGAVLVVAALFGVAAQAQEIFEHKMTVTPDMLSASSTYDGYTPSTCFDGDLTENHGWCASGGDRDAWLAMDFGTSRLVTRVRVIPDRYIASDPSYSYLDSFHVEIWEGGTWVGASSETRFPSRKRGHVLVLEAFRGYDIKPIPWLCRCGIRKSVWSPLGFYC